MKTLGYDHNKSFYAQSIKDYGVSHKGVHWSTKYNQYVRFDVLTDFIKEDIKNATIIDAGCGFAEYYTFLEKNQTEPSHYIGIDCEHSMIFRSQLRFPKLDFYVKNILEDKLLYADYYLCSGALNILKEEEFYRFIKRCYHFSEKGFAFNFLTKDSFNNIKKQDVVSFCKTICNDVQIKELYLYNDMTIFMKK